MTAIKIIRDRIQFEDCGDASAAAVWQASVERELPFNADVVVGVGKDHRKYECYIAAGKLLAFRCGRNGKIKLAVFGQRNEMVEMTAAQRKFFEPLFAAIDTADDRGWECAREASV